MIFLKDYDPTDEEMKEARNAFGKIPPEISKGIYKALCKSIGPDIETGIIPTISRIKSHKLGLFKDRCTMSDGEFIVFLFRFVNHKTQLAGFTFRVGKQIKFNE